MTSDAASPQATPTPWSRVARWRPHANPVLRRELVERWRGRRAFVVATTYLTILTGMMLLLLWAASSWLESGFAPRVDPGPTLGRFLLENVFGLVLLLVLFVGPGYAAAQISQERERRTLGLLQITLVSPWRIVTGKLGAASAWLLLLVLLAAPMASAAFFLGGVTVADVLRGVTYVGVVTVAVAALGIGISSMVRRTVAAIVLTYALVLGLVGGTVFGTIIEAAVARDLERPRTILANPFTGLADAVRASDSVELPSMLTPFVFALPEENRSGQFGGSVVVGPAVPEPGLDGFAPAPQPGFEAPTRTPVWLLVMLGYATAGLGALAVAARRVRPGHEPGGGRSRRDRSGDAREVVVPPDAPIGAGTPPPPRPGAPPASAAPPPPTAPPSSPPSSPPPPSPPPEQP